ncbi:hypothetical protein [Hydrogenophaga sp.]|uniref:hypothetical protein n=1 Tax=Hydrogenophaga sp. TaxID=1904254 RepID=UPI002717132B|nr:hypothetical protein [Hydrogenophaga sp.]MDO9434968.1 hypothetical protein [Hydrogenophaga sp.]
MKSSKKMLLVLAFAWMTGLLVAVSSPSDVLSRFEILNEYASLYVCLFSYKNALGSASEFPEVTRLYHSLLVWTIPLFSIVSYRWMKLRVGRERDGILFKRVLSIFNKLALIALLPIWIGLIWFVGMNDGGDVRLVPFGSSRGALGLFGISLPFLVGVLFSAIAFSVRRVFFEKGGEK